MSDKLHPPAKAADAISRKLNRIYWVVTTINTTTSPAGYQFCEQVRYRVVSRKVRAACIYGVGNNSSPHLSGDAGEAQIYPIGDSPVVGDMGYR